MIKTYKIAYSANKTEADWDGSFAICNHSDQTTKVNILFIDEYGKEMKEQNIVIAPWALGVLGSEDLLVGRQSIEITGENLLITPFQFNKTGIASPKIFEVESKKS